jgi:hypothetical protein
MQKISNERFDHLYLRELCSRLQKHLLIEVKEFNDCKLASEKLLKSGFVISAHTLARFFGILKSNHRPYTSTLNLMCQYIGADSFAAFCNEVKQKTEHALYSPVDAFKTGPFSLITLEIALANEDWKSVQEIVGNFQVSNPFKNELVMLLGKSVRYSHKRELLLKKLIEIEHGRLLFYESYVDEDDPGGYYSHALKKYYKSSFSNSKNQLFLHCFIMSKAIYLNEVVDLTLLKSSVLNLDAPFKKLHFHEISRYLELQILLDFKKGFLKSNLINHLEQVTELTAGYVYNDKCTQELLNHDRCWIVARSLKALSFSGFLKDALKHDGFRMLIEELYRGSSKNIGSIAELIIQFVVHGMSKPLGKGNDYFPPKRITALHDNETHSRIVIEAATSLLYAEDKIKPILEKNVYSFAKKTGHTWLFELLA